MKRRRQLVMLIMLLVSLAAPIMACSLPDAQMNTEERACCRSMRNQCGQMEMPASHGCCHKSAHALQYRTVEAKVIQLHSAASEALIVAIAEWQWPALSLADWVERPDHSPPKSLPPSITVLRI